MIKPTNHYKHLLKQILVSFGSYLYTERQTIEELISSDKHSDSLLDSLLEFNNIFIHRIDSELLSLLTEDRKEIN